MATELNVATDEEIIEELADRFKSMEWWIVLCPMAHTGGTDIMQDIEEKYYKPNTKANGDFHLIVTNKGVLIFYLKKTRLTRKQMRYYIPIINNKHDILSLNEKDNELHTIMTNSFIGDLDDLLRIRNGSYDSNGV